MRKKLASQIAALLIVCAGLGRVVQNAVAADAAAGRFAQLRIRFRPGACRSSRRFLAPGKRGCAPS